MNVEHRESLEEYIPCDIYPQQRGQGSWIKDYDQKVFGFICGVLIFKMRIYVCFLYN